MSFIDGFEKAAWDLSKARKAFSSVKDKLIRRSVGAVSRPDPAHVTGILPKKQIASPVSVSQKTLPHHNKDLSPVMTQGGGKIFAAGDSSKTISSIAKGNIPRGKAWSELKDSLSAIKSPKEKELLNRTVLQHEVSEDKWYPRLKQTDAMQNFVGHKHPQVILEESNMVSSMPKGSENVKDVFRKMREADGSKALLENHVPGYEYGKTRLSRHGRKRVFEAFDKNMKKFKNKYSDAASTQIDDGDFFE